MSVIRTAFSDPIVEDTGDLTKLVDQVVDGHTPIVVARNGEPKAALVSMEDYARLKQEEQGAKTDKKLSWQEWESKSRQLREDILARRGNKPIDLDWFIQETRKDLEDRDAYRSGT